VFITALTGVLIDLDKAVLLGIGLSIVLFVPRAAKLKASELIVTPERVVRERIPGDLVDPSAVIYDLEGELFFGAAPDLDRYLDTLEARVRTNAAKFVVLRLKRVRHPDAVCVERLLRFVREQEEQGLTVLLAGVRPDTLTVLRNMGLQRWLPAEQVFPEEDTEYSATLKAVRFARTKLAVDSAHAISTNGIDHHPNPVLYYLVSHRHDDGLCTSRTTSCSCSATSSPADHMRDVDAYSARLKALAAELRTAGSGGDSEYGKDIPSRSGLSRRPAPECHELVVGVENQRPRSML
jgi:ABC-type transporter Mla MlaB component